MKLFENDFNSYYCQSSLRGTGAILNLQSGHAYRGWRPYLAITRFFTRF